MFRHEGPSRSAAKNAAVAGYLAFMAGFVNSGGFLLIGSFTSHVTGSVGRISTDVAAGELAAAVLAVLLVAMFFLGAFGATLIIEGHRPGRVSRAYATALAVEGSLLALFVFVAGLSQTTHPRLLDAKAAILCLAMGMQNSLVTRLSGAVVRTTHLTGVMTDLAIEAARWYRWHRARLHLPVLLGAGSKAERPEATRATLLATIVVTFVSGALLGALLTMRTSRWAMVLPALGVLAASALAFLQPEVPVPAPPSPVPAPAKV